MILRRDAFAIVDDFLPERDFEHLWNFFQEESFSPVHAQRWTKAFRLSDGQPFWGGVFLSHALSYDAKNPVFPTRRGIDVFFQAMARHSELIEQYVGRQGIDWDAFFCRPYIYGAGAGLSWHTDGRADVRGAYVYYGHRTWKAHWGGELLIDESGRRDLKYPLVDMYGGERKALGMHIDAGAASDAALALGLGSYILPKPNRLVLLREGVLHSIKRVDPNAGENLRLSLTGFFLDESARVGPAAE